MGNTSSASEPIVTGVADMVRCSGANGSGSSEVRSFFSLIFLTVVTFFFFLVNENCITKKEIGV
ncbi:hypothetical protein YC2023_055555 [Brassica napus]|uniref:Uncharacterized protein n=2 Tax=Brassica TaxID=3705 RepID=A0A3P6CXV0_BRAOL|nr:unnamed protein product [Brassica napus]VDD15305.1 unnamed protein product [Brassica oleracea]